jgi:hypothetical protein
MRVFLTVVGVALLGCWNVFAQTVSVQPVSTGGHFTFVLEKPNASSGGSIDCNRPSSSCAPLNLAACSTSNRNIQFTVQRKQDAVVVPTRKIWAWLQKGTSDCIYASTGSPHKLLNGSQGDASGLAVSGAVMRIPDDISSTATLTTDDLLKTGVDGNVCTGTGVETSYRICVGVDNDNDGDIDANSTGFSVADLRGYIDLLVDTVAPLAPSTPTATALDGRLEVSVGYTTEPDSDTVSFWETWSRASEEAKEDCSTWAEGTYTITRVSGTASGLSITVPATNGIRTAVCAVAWDAVGNPSTPSQVIYATAQDECDFFECAPADVQGGYCGASGAVSQLWGAVALYTAWRMLRRKQALS